MAAGAKIAAAAQWLWNVAVAAFPVILIVVAIAAAIAAIWYFRDEIGAFLTVAWSKITEVFGAIADFLKVWGPRMLLLAFPPALVAAVLFKFREQIWDAITGIFDAVGGFFADLGRVFYDAGKALIMALVDGIVATALAPYNAVKDILGKARDLLPFSDAKEGPLSRLTQSGRRIGETLAAGVDQSGETLQSAVWRILPNPSAFAAPLPVGPVPTPAAAGGGQGAGARSLTISIERVEVIAQGVTAEEVAGEFVGEIRRQIRGVVEEFDSGIDA